MKFKGILIFLIMATGLNAQDYLVKLPFNDEQIVIDDNVNVRSAPGMSGTKLFKLDTGDKVKILSKSLRDYDYWKYPDKVEFDEKKAEADSENFDLVEGIYSPWYEIECSKGKGYITGRYVSCKNISADFDGDGKTEILACLTINNTKGALQFDSGLYKLHPLHDCWELSLYNKDINHILIDSNNTAKKVSFEGSIALSKSGETKYSIKKLFSPVKNLVVLEIDQGYRSYGDGEISDDYYYYDGNDFKHIFSNDTFDTNSHIVSVKDNYIRDEYTIYICSFDRETENERYLIWDHTETIYRWNGKNFEAPEVRQLNVDEIDREQYK